MRRKAIVAAALVAVAGAIAAVLGLSSGPDPTTAASHREAPLISQDPTADVTDLYAFVSPDKPNTVTFIADWIPFEEPSAGPNWYSFSTKARYEIKIDNTGDARPDITYRWTFKDGANSLSDALPLGCLASPCQTYTLTQITDGRTHRARPQSARGAEQHRPADGRRVPGRELRRGLALHDPEPQRRRAGLRGSRRRSVLR